MKRHLLLFALAAGLALGATAQDTLTMTLDSCLRYAYRNNYSALGAELTLQSAEVALQGAKLNFLPTVGASAGHTLQGGSATQRNTTVGLNASLTLFDGLNNTGRLRQARTEREASELRLQQTRNSIGSQVVAAYLNILMNEELMAYQREVATTSRHQRAEGEAKYEVGRILESDYRLLEASSLVAETELENTRLSLEDLRMDLAVLIGCEGGEVIAVVPPADTTRAEAIVLPPIDSVMARAREALPDWALAEHEVQAARIGVDLARSAFMPNLSLNAGTSYVRNDPTASSDGAAVGSGMGSSVGLSLSVPILNRGASLTQLRTSKINLQQAELAKRQADNELAERIADQYYATRQALLRYRAAQASMAAYRSSYEVYAAKYAEGMVTTVEMLQQQDKYLSALNDYLQSKYSYLMAEKQLDIFTGKEIKL